MRGTRWPSRARGRARCSTTSAATATRRPTTTPSSTTSAASSACSLDFDEEIDDGVATGGVRHAAACSTTRGGAYRVFTTAYDREVDAATLVRAGAAAPTTARSSTAASPAQGVNVARLARELRALLAEPARDGWDGGQEEGHVDGRRLAQLVASPTERRLFRTERHEPVADCVVELPDRLLGLDEGAHRVGRDAGRRARRARSSRPASPARSSASPPAPGTAAARSATGSAPAGRRTRAGSTSAATSSSRTPTRRGAARGPASPRC